MTARPVIPGFDLGTEVDRETKLYKLMRGNMQVDTESAERDYLKAQFQAHCVIPEFLRKGAKTEVPFIAHMRSGGFDTIQDMASELMTHCEDSKTVERLAREIYEEASKRIGYLTDWRDGNCT